MLRTNNGTPGAEMNLQGRPKQLFPMNLQMFAGEGGAGEEGGQGDTGGSGEGDKGTKPLTMTQEEFDKRLQSEADKRVSEALKTNQVKLEAEWKAKFEAEKSEAEKLAKMSAEERAKAELEKERSEFAKDRVTFNRERLELETVKEMAKRDLPTTLSKFVLGDTAEATTENLKAFEEAYRASIEKAVIDRLKGKTPPSGNPSTTVDNAALEKMSMEEYAAYRAKQ